VIKKFISDIHSVQCHTRELG